MSTNSAIIKNVGGIIHRNRAEDRRKEVEEEFEIAHLRREKHRKKIEEELEKVRTNADFSMTNDKNYSVPEKIEHAIDAIHKETRRTRRINGLEGVFGLLTFVAFFAIFVLTFATGGHFFNGNKPTTLVAGISFVVALIVGPGGMSYCRSRSVKKELMLFWAARINNLIDEHNAELNQEEKDYALQWSIIAREQI